MPFALHFFAFRLLILLAITIAPPIHSVPSATLPISVHVPPAQRANVVAVRHLSVVPPEEGLEDVEALSLDIEEAEKTSEGDDTFDAK